MPTEKDLEQGRFFANRVAKRDKHLRKWARKSDTDCYRVYDRDIPELPLSLDRYGDAAVLYLYERPYEKPEAEETAWLELMAGVAADSLGIAREAVAVKTRRRLGLESQYERAGPGDRREPVARERVASERVVRENGLSFLVNLGDYIDTGLFMDHRPARALVRESASGKRVLNLFCYTGSFSVYALAGGASEVVGVDLSNTYLAWAERNVALNGFGRDRYRGVRSDVQAFLEGEAARGARYDSVVLDPPTFSNSKKVDGFLDIVRHWPSLVGSCLGVLAPGGSVLFSTNARTLRLDPSLAPGASIEDISERTIPEDFRGHPHRTWIIRPA
ncbi:MAG: class I SAM-dependent methyltransferase [Spirochaetes bacterium]|nr:class I SAM-dependent methyltransferase [Spirochaetota bacterium]MBU1079634.1 class I SAM-dependent methyltransferase [Spirochaetota bacterium]